MNNISSLSNPNLIKSAKNQILDKGVNKLKTTILSNSEELVNDLDNLITKNKKLVNDFNDEIKKINNSTSLSDIEKKKKIEEITSQFNTEKDLINEQIKNIKNKIIDSSNDILKKAKNEGKKINNSISKKNISAQKDSLKAKVLRNKQIITNNKKSIAPIIINQLTNVLIKLIDNNVKIGELIDKTNTIIDNASTPTEINQALLVRNNTIAIINSQENKIISLQKTLKDISNILQIFSITLSVLSSLAIPVSTIPGIGIPLIVITKITKLIEKINNLIEELSTTLSIIIPNLQKIVNELEQYKSQLHEINLKLDIESSDSTEIYNNIKNNFSNLSMNNFDEYKGFKFAIKEDQNLGAHSKITVGEFKRHYAVAINKDGVEVLQSDYSFTLDPNDLIEQLKIQIDTLNLVS